MNHRNLINDAWVYSSNVRAEDGLQPPRGWNVSYHAQFYPNGSVDGNIGDASSVMFCVQPILELVSRAKFRF